MGRRIRPAEHLRDLERMRDRVSHRADERRDRGVPNFIELRERAALDWALPKLHAWAEAERLKAPEHRRPAPEVTAEPAHEPTPEGEP